jgi:beta-xylosidase
MDINPIIKLDYPDPDVIRVGNTYYMVSTTMYFMPGCEILRSYDLINWEHAAYVYETLDSTPEQRLESGNIYGQGMWAACIRYHKGVFYVCFSANDTQKTYLYKAKNISGEWEKTYIEGFYHDPSLLFDDVGKVYIVYGNKDIWLTELKKDLSAPMEDGLHKIIASDIDNNILGYEGSHIYKIHDKYYLFLIHSRKDRWFRTQACFMADTLDGEWCGGDVLEDDRNYFNQGVAQGGIVDTPDEKWYAVLFQDMGAVGRIPVLVSVTWKNSFPVFNIPKERTTVSTKPDYEYTPLVESDDFKSVKLNPHWQFNHEPDKNAYLLNNYYEITTNKLCDNLTQAKNTLTQRMLFPKCSAEVTINASGIKDGDYAGICALQGCYAMIGITRRDGRFYAVMADNSSEHEAIPVDSAIVRLRLEADFRDMKDEAVFYLISGEQRRKIGTIHKLHFKLDHFTGCRFGLFMYATKDIGGSAKFEDFEYIFD